MITLLLSITNDQKANNKVKKKKGSKFIMNAVKFFLTLLFLPICLGWLIYLKLFGEKPKPKKIKPKLPVKIIPKYTKNKLYLSKYYKNPWEKRKKSKKINNK